MRHWGKTQRTTISRRSLTYTWRQRESLSVPQTLPRRGLSMHVLKLHKEGTPKTHHHPHQLSYIQPFQIPCCHPGTPGRTPHRIRHSSDFFFFFTIQFQNLRLATDEPMVSHDVTSLITAIPTSEAVGSELLSGENHLTICSDIRITPGSKWKPKKWRLSLNKSAQWTATSISHSLGGSSV